MPAAGVGLGLWAGAAPAWGTAGWLRRCESDLRQDALEPTLDASDPLGQRVDLAAQVSYRVLDPVHLVRLLAVQGQQRHQDG